MRAAKGWMCFTLSLIYFVAAAKVSLGGWEPESSYVAVAAFLSASYTFMKAVEW